MENASKALLMAGAVLIGVMLLSFMVMIFYIFGNFSKEQQAQISDKTTQQFNMQFLIYEGKNKNAHDVVSVIHLVKDIKAGNTSISQGYNDNIKVTVSSTPGIQSVSQNSREDELIKFLEQSYNSDGSPKVSYTCTVQYNEEGRVDTVKFSK